MYCSFEIFSHSIRHSFVEKKILKASTKSCCVYQQFVSVYFIAENTYKTSKRNLFLVLAKRDSMEEDDLTGRSK